MTDPVLVVRSLDWVYGTGPSRVQVLFDVELSADAGDLVALVGPSGSGKSTLCHVVSGLEPFRDDSGTVRVAGRPPEQIRDWATLAVVPQQHGLVPGLTVRDNVALPVLRARGDDEGVDDVLDALDLTRLQRHDATAVSLGEQQRTAVARALVLRPRMLVLDEPSGHQDGDHVELLAGEVRRAADRGTTVLMATHDDDLIAIADRVVRLVDGRVA